MRKRGFVDINFGPFDWKATQPSVEPTCFRTPITSLLGEFEVA